MTDSGVGAQEQRHFSPGRRAEDKLLAEHANQGRLFRALVNSACDGIVGLNLDGSVLVWNHGAEKLFGYSESEVAGTDIAKLFNFEHDWWSHGVRHWEGSQLHRDGHTLEVAIESSPVLDDPLQKPEHFVWIVRDITARARWAYQLQMRQAELQEEARTDPLTGAANRRRMEEVLQVELSRAQRHSTSLSLLLIDLDHLKAINDQHSHVIGDAAIKVFADVIQKQLRICDLLARLGGDEFVVLMPDTDSMEAGACALRLQSALDKATVPNLPSKLTASLGIAVYRNGESADTLLRRADQALYRAKQNGRNCAVHWEDMKPIVADTARDDLPRRALLRQIIEDALREGRQLRLNCRNYSRVVVPHALEGGDDDPILVAWQLNGGCESGITTGLKRFHLSEIQGLSPYP